MKYFYGWPNHTCQSCHISDVQDKEIAEKFQFLQGKSSLETAPPSELLTALNDIHQCIGQGTSLLDRLMDASVGKIKEELKGKKELAKSYKQLEEKLALVKQGTDSKPEPVVEHSRVSLTTAKVLIACQSCTVAETVWWSVGCGAANASVCEGCFSLLDL